MCDLFCLLLFCRFAENYIAMSAKTLNDRIALLSTIEDFGEEGGTYEKICFSYKLKTGKGLTQRNFLRCREEIFGMFGIRIGVRKDSKEWNYYVDYSGKQRSKHSTPNCMNAFLLNGVITDDRFAKDRIFICDSFKNDLARKVAQAITLHKDIIVERNTTDLQLYINENGEQAGKVVPITQTFNFTPYALSFTSQWFMFGKIDRKGSLMVFSLDKTNSVETTFDFGNSPEVFDLDKVLDNFDSELPLCGYYDDDRLLFRSVNTDSEAPNRSNIIGAMAKAVVAHMTDEDKKLFENISICQKIQQKTE